MGLRKPQAHAASAIETELIGDRVLLTRMRGHLTRVLAEQQYDHFRTLLFGIKTAHWIIEQLELTGFDPGAVPAGARWFNAFRERGGEKVIFVSALPAARMVAASLAFAAHAKISSCDSLKEAYERAGVGTVEVRPSAFSLKPPAKT